VGHGFAGQREVREMARIEKSIEINAPVEKVFDFVADGHNTLRFYEDIYAWSAAVRGGR